MLEKNEQDWKKPEEYLVYGITYAIVAKGVKEYHWLPQTNPPDAEKLYSKSFSLIRKSIEIGATANFKETACLYLSGVHRQKDDYEGQYKSIELTASVSESAVRKSFYYYYIASQMMTHVRKEKLREEDRRLKERARGYFETSLKAYPYNYETLIYISNNCEAAWEKKAYYDKARRALANYEVDSKRDNVNRVSMLLKKFDPYYR